MSTQLTLQTEVIQGVKFFASHTSCIDHFEKETHWTEKAISLIKSYATLLIYAFNKISLVVHQVDNQIEPLTIANNRLSKKRLIVCVHGLNNNPTQFKEIVDKIKEKNPSDTDIFIPHVLQKGNAPLDQMVEPILDEIAKWAEGENDKELVLVGISNGGRISRAIEAELIRSNRVGNIRKIKFVSIVGACKGSTLANLANNLGLSWLMSKNISEEMPTDSPRNRRLNQDWNDGFATTSRPVTSELVPGTPVCEYTFIASPHDWQVPNYDSSLMEVNGQRARYAIIPGHGHNSIVNAIAKSVAEIILPAPS